MDVDQPVKQSTDSDAWCMPGVDGHCEVSEFESNPPTTNDEVPFEQPGTSTSYNKLSPQHNEILAEDFDSENDAEDDTHYEEHVDQFDD